jgi:hypothetical protein
VALALGSARIRTPEAWIRSMDAARSGAADAVGAGASLSGTASGDAEADGAGADGAGAEADGDA